MFRPSDERRVKTIFNDALPAPYEALITVSRDRLEIHVTVEDPDEPELVVASGFWTFDPKVPKAVQQPLTDELKAIAAAHAAICAAYPDRKAADAAEKAERDSRQIDAKTRAQAERALKSSAAKILGADEITPALVEAIENAASDPALD